MSPVAVVKSIAAKVPHYVVGLGIVATIWGPDLVKTFVAFNMTAEAAWTQKALTFVVALVAWAKYVTPAPAAKVNDTIKPPPLVGTLLMVLLLTVAAQLVAAMAGCSWFQSNPQVVSSVSDIAACVLSHDTEQPDQIAVECGGIAVSDVLKILSAEQAAKARASCPQPVDAGPGK